MSTTDIGNGHILPGALTFYDKIPQELRCQRSWIIYKVLQVGTKLKKIPLNWQDPEGRPIDTSVPELWGTFEQVRHVCENDPYKRFGVGLVLTPECSITCFDIDGDNPQIRDLVIAKVEALPHRTWCEHSISGKGRHYFFIGQLPHGLGSLNGVVEGLEIYCDKRFIAITGNTATDTYGGEYATTLDNATETLTALYETMPDDMKRRMHARATYARTGSYGDAYGYTGIGVKGLSDERVETLLRERKPASYAKLNMSAEKGSGVDGSQAFMEVIGDLLKITSDIDQVRYIVDRSILGMSRPDKFPRLFDEWVDEALASNTQGIANITEADKAAGRILKEQWHAAWDAGMHETPECIERTSKILDEYLGTSRGLSPAEERLYIERVAAKAAESLNSAAHQATPDPVAISEDTAHPVFAAPPITPATVVAKGSPQLDEVLAYLGCGVTKENSPIDPALGALIEHNLRASKTPYYTFSEFATVAFMSAIHARKFKTFDGLSSSLNCLMVANSTIGKGEAFDFWQRAISNCAAAHRQYSNVFNGSVVSAQGLHEILQNTGTTVLYKADAGGELLNLAQPGNAGQASLRDRIYELFDASRLGSAPFSPGGSISASKREDKALHNVAGTLVWSCTPEAFYNAYSDEFLATGGGSRLLVHLHEGPAGRLVRDDQVSRDLDIGLVGYLSTLLAEIAELDQVYEVIAEGAKNPEQVRNDAIAEAKAKVVVVKYTQEASDLLWKLEQRISVLADAINAVPYPRLPKHYSIFARSSMLVKKAALTSTVVRNRMAPVIGVKDVMWGIRFVLGCLGSLARAFDTGIAGDVTDSKREAAIVEWFAAFPKAKDSRLNAQTQKEGWVPLWFFKERAAQRKAFTSKYTGSVELLKRTLEGMEAAGQVQCEKRARGFVYRYLGEFD